MAWRERVAQEKRAAYREESYWGRPVPAFGDPRGRLLVVGLAPAAHGANRTGRMFTGDRSGDWLYRALHRAGFANQPESHARDDGLRLTDVVVTAAVRCAPPANKPAPPERDTCRPWLEAEIEVLRDVRALVTLGAFAYHQTLRVLAGLGLGVPRPRPRFGHGLELSVRGNRDSPGAGCFEGRDVSLLCSYHPSQQNTFTGTLTEEMFDAIWSRARELIDA